MQAKNNNKKRKGLSERLTVPFIVLIISMAIVVFFAFNFAMRAYMRKSAHDQLLETRSTVVTLLRKELSEELLSAEDSDAITAKSRALIVALNSAIKVTQSVSNSEIAILGANGRLLLPREEAISVSLDQAITEVQNKIIAGIDTDTFNLRDQGVNFLVSYETFNESKLASRTQYLVIVASLEGMEKLVRRINILLVMIMAGVTILGTLIASSVASRVTKPMKEISKYSKRIIDNDYTPLVLETHTDELDTLILDLNQMGESLEVKEQSKVDFLQNFSHDLRTPLMSIQGYAEGIVTGVFEDPQKPAQIIANESLRLKHLVDQLITLSRLESNGLKVQKDTLELFDFLNLLVERHEGVATQIHKQIVLNCPKELKIVTVEDHLEKAVGNLLSNAIRYADSHVIIDVTAQKNEVTITVQDDGPGISESILPRIFDRFSKGNDGNFGLGTAIAHKAIEQLGGTLTAKNHSKGAVFEIHLYEVHSRLNN